MEPRSRIELPTSSLPRKRSTPELPGPKYYEYKTEQSETKKNGGERRIRTFEGGADRFTVCSLWPLGNLPPWGMVLTGGFELPTGCLQNSCSTN